ncbi:MAG: AAA family ATPase [Nitrospirota bacterium]
MYLKNIDIQNVGPIENIGLEFPFDDNGNPKPVILVGENGTGKSIVLSFIVNGLIAAKQVAYEDIEVEKGKVYKYRTPLYITSGKNFYYAKLIFEETLEYIEWQLDRSKKDFEETLQYCPLNQDWNRIPDQHDTSAFLTNFHNDAQKIKNLFQNNCILFFPPNRFEEPAWLNLENLLAKANYSELKNIMGYSNRSILIYSALKDIQNWLLDITYDSRVLEMQTFTLVQDNQTPQITAFLGYNGPNTNIFNEINKFLKLLFETGQPVRFAIEKKHSRKVAIYKNDQPWIPNLFNLSTGETVLFSLFCSVLRDYDLTGREIQSTRDVRGIVLIDEIDIHLHTDLQRKILPQLIKLFPRVQFIITTHSPLFLLGMHEVFAENGFVIREMPQGEIITAERFEEFERAYNYFKNTKTFEEDIKKEIQEAHKPILYVEGDYDVRYIEKAGEALDKKELLCKVKLKDGGGFGNLNKIWKQFDYKLSEVLPQKIILLYDCDLRKQDAEQGNLYKRVAPTISDNPIKEGIENLFPSETINKAMAHSKKFIDVTGEVKKTERGQEIIVPKKHEVNKDEKGNLCDWLCKNGTKEDFKHFEKVFEIIEKIIHQDDTCLDKGNYAL